MPLPLFSFIDESCLHTKNINQWILQPSNLPFFFYTNTYAKTDDASYEMYLIEDI